MEFGGGGGFLIKICCKELIEFFMVVIDFFDCVIINFLWLIKYFFMIYYLKKWKFIYCLDGGLFCNNELVEFFMFFFLS